MNRAQSKSLHQNSDMKKFLKAILPEESYLKLCRMKSKMRRALCAFLYHLFMLLPIQDNKVVFDNYMGKGYGCNPKYVARKFLETGKGNFDLVWVVTEADREHSDLPAQIRQVTYGTMRSYYEYATAKVWVSNYHKVQYVKKGLRKRRGQYFIQMWHGSLGIKKIESAVPSLISDQRWISAAVKSSSMTDYWISNSDFETNIFKTAFWNVSDRSILLYGHPRNDIFFSAQDMDAAYRKVSASSGFKGKKLLLYAPTFREDYRMNCYLTDFSAVLEHVKNRFGGEWAVLVRLHPRVREHALKVIPESGNIADVTWYPDIQELLAAADILITDYSSCMFDFMLSARPVFLFAPDLEEYNTERGFYFPLETTPFSVALDEKELGNNIEQFEEDAYAAGVEAFLKSKGCIEDGHASERVVKLIRSLAAGSGRGQKAKREHKRQAF